jgi:hypothetical protein
MIRHLIAIIFLVLISITANAETRQKSTGSITLTNTTETAIIAACGTGVFCNLQLIFCSNTSATPVRADVRDVAAGTVRFPLYLPAGDFRGFATAVPVGQTTANSAWTVQLSGSVTDVRCFAQAIKETNN